MTVRNTFLLGIGIYGCLWILARPLTTFIETYIGHEAALPASLFYFALFVLLWTAIIYIGNRILSIQKLSLQPPNILLYVGTFSFFGPLGEILTNIFAIALFGNPLWTYHILPVHNGATSLVMFFLWGLYGFHVYLFHQNSYIRNASYKNLLIGLFVAIDALVLEYFVNITSIYLFGSYLFYYFPNDLSHLSTAVIAPAYIFMGYCAAVLLKKFELRPILFGSLGLAGGYLLVFVAGAA